MGIGIIDGVWGKKFAYRFNIAITLSILRDAHPPS